MTIGYVIKGALKNLRHQKLGKCNICGNFTVFICTDVGTATNNMYCLFCVSSSRKRHIAKTILEEVIKGISSSSKIPKGKDIKIYNTDVGELCYRVLHKYESYICSGLSPDVEPAIQIRERVFCQNIENLTF